MSGERPRFLFFEGKIVPYADARIHMLATVFKYAAAVFEGLRAYYNETTGKLYVFRLREHIDRLFDSAKIARIPIGYTGDELQENLLALIRRNELRQDLHVRISAFVAEDDGRLNSTEPAGLSMAAIPMGRYDAL